MSAPFGAGEAATMSAFPVGGLLPKQETQSGKAPPTTATLADITYDAYPSVTFLRKHPEYDGRGTVVAVLDTGVDPAAKGLQVTSTGLPKLIDIVDCTGSGDVDTTTVVSLEDNTSGEVKGLSGRALKLNPAWNIPSKSIRLGIKRAYDLFPRPLVSRMQDQRKARWDIEQHQHMTNAQRELSAFDAAHPKSAVAAEDKKTRTELDERCKQLQDLQSKFDDPGPIHDVVVFHDGSVWRAAVDVHEKGDLTEAEALTDYFLERQLGFLAKEEAMMSYAINIYENGNVCSIVTTCGSHGTHVAG